MATRPDRKMYLGPRLRGLRRELGVNQTRMAEELGVSPSYLNHLERNQRPLTAQMLVRLAETYDIDIRAFVAGASEGGASDLTAAFADPLVREIGVPRHELTDIAENYPGVAEAIGRFARALAEARQRPAADGDAATGDTGARAPLAWLDHLLQHRRNHFAELDNACEALTGDLGEEPSDLAASIRQRLAERHRIGVWITPRDVLGGTLRHFDLHRRRLMLSDRLDASSRLFALAYQLCLVELEPALTETVTRAAPPDADCRTLLRVALANYGAAAIVMPYARLRAAAEESRHDLPLLMARFGVSFEQLTQRLTTLGRPNERGIPFFLVRIDSAGTVSKRIAGEAYPFARHGGVCPRWRVDGVFNAGGEIVAQAVETPDARRFTILARAQPASSALGGLVPQVIAIGCEQRHAGAIVHADAVLPDRVTPTSIGPSCTLCERSSCPDRAAPPVARTVEYGVYRRPVSPFPFRRI